jgi:hypothetical protein
VGTLFGPTADRAGWQTGFSRRDSPLRGSTFVQTLVFGFLRAPRATLGGLGSTAAQVGAAVSSQAIDQRCTVAAAHLLRTVLAAALRTVVTAEPAAGPLLARFPAVVLQDSTTIALPDALATEWAGCGGRTPQGTAAALKLQVQLEARQGTLHAELQPGRASDQTGALIAAPGAPGTLHVNDLGYFALPRLQAWSAAGEYWVTYLKGGTQVHDAAGRDVTAPAYLRQAGRAPLDLAVQVGASSPLAARLVVVPAPPEVAQARRRKLRATARREGRTPNATRLAWADWTLVLTNVPAEQLCPAELLVVLRVRWQLELLFKLWKADDRFGHWQSAKPVHQLCELYAKLLGLIVQHWLLLVGCWEHDDRSLLRAAPVLAGQIGVLLLGFRGVLSLEAAIAETVVGMGGSRVAKRRRYPATYQLVRDPHLPLPHRERPPARRGRKPHQARRLAA